MASGVSLDLVRDLANLVAELAFEGRLHCGAEDPDEDSPTKEKV